MALNTKAKELAASGRQIFNLTAGELDCATPEYIISRVIPHLNQNKYSPTAGLPELRENLAQHCQKFYKAPWIKAENIVVTGGAEARLVWHIAGSAEPRR